MGIKLGQATFFGLVTLATWAGASPIVADARFSLSAAVAVDSSPLISQHSSNAAGTVSAAINGGAGSVTAGADEQGVPFIQFGGASPNRQSASVQLSGAMYYNWSVVGNATAGELVPITITTLGNFNASVTATSLQADKAVSASVDWMDVGVLTRFNTSSTGGFLDARSHGVMAGRPVFGNGVGTLVDFDEVVSAAGGSATASGSSSFSQTFTLMVNPNDINSIELHAWAREGGAAGTWLGFRDAAYTYSFSGYVDPIITVDAAYADRFSIVQSAIPFVQGTSPVPEPSTLAMVMGALGWLGWTRKRRQH